MNIITHPSAYVARKIENIILLGANSNLQFTKFGCFVIARVISTTVFPIFLLMELILKRVPKWVVSITLYRDSEKIYKNAYKIQKHCLAILSFPLGLFSADAISGFFLKNPYAKNMLKPFCTAEQYGKTAVIYYPQAKEDLQNLVKEAIEQKKQISIVGAGMSQGLQTIPYKKNQMVINTKKLQEIDFLCDNQSVKAQAGATWEQVQVAANKLGKSVIAKQAFDTFSIGGSISINCHGWAHKAGPISSTIESLEIINANGELQVLIPKDELFRCMFGTLGYFGLIVSATIKLTDNEHLIEKAEEIQAQEFVTYYKNNIKEKDNIPLFTSKLTLDVLEGNPLRNVCMVRYERDTKSNKTSSILVTEDFTFEPKFGTLLERITLHVLSCLPKFLANRAISRYWFQERINILKGKNCTRNAILHPHINALMKLNRSRLHAQWLQEYFIKEENLSNFLSFLGAELKANQVLLINAAIRPVPKDEISILPYAEQDRYAVVICFYQEKTKAAKKRTENWTKRVIDFVIKTKDTFYQAYLPIATKEEFKKCYGSQAIENLHILKKKYDPLHVFGNAHTAKYFDT